MSELEPRAADGLIVASVIADSEADRAGVQPGDRLVAINGRRLRNLREYSRVQRQCECRRRTNVAVRALGPSILRHAYASSPSVFPALRFLPVHVGLLASLVFSLVVIYSRPEDRVARLGALLLASMACASAPFWPTGLAGTWRHLPVLAGALLWPACLSTVSVGPIMFSLFAVFPRSVIRRQLDLDRRAHARQRWSQRGSGTI